MARYVDTAVLSKVAYSIVLLAVLWIFLKELHRVWFDRQTYVSTPAYFADGKTDAAKATAFGGAILAHHHRLSMSLAAEAKELREQVSDQDELFPIRASRDSALSRAKPADSLELKIQGFDFGALLTKIRSWVSPLDEVEVTVEARSVGKQDATVEAAVSWPFAPTNAPTSVSPLRYFSTSRQPSDEEASAIVAANLLWGDLGVKEPAIRKVPRDEFVIWLLAWERYRAVRDLHIAPSQLNAEHKKVLESAGSGIKDLLTRGPKFAEVWRLAANLVAQHPQSIAGMVNPWEFYRDEYEVAIGKRLPSTRTAVAQALPSNQVVPGTLMWRDDGRRAARVTAIVRDASGKRFLLLSSLVVDPKADTLPIDLFGSESQSKGRAPVARAVELVPLDAKDPNSATVLLAELVSGVAANNAGLSGSAAAPMLGVQLTALSGGRSGTVSTIAIVGSLANGLIAVQPKVTSAGDAGMPFLDASGGLAAMGFAGDAKSSLLIPLPDVLAARGLKVE